MGRSEPRGRPPALVSLGGTGGASPLEQGELARLPASTAGVPGEAGPGELPPPDQGAGRGARAGAYRAEARTERQRDRPTAEPPWAGWSLKIHRHNSGHTSRGRSGRGPEAEPLDQVLTPHRQQQGRPCYLRREWGPHWARIQQLREELVPRGPQAGYHHSLIGGGGDLTSSHPAFLEGGG